jgi:copper homeostasis protein
LNVNKIDPGPPQGWLVLEHGADGIVFGILNSDGTVDAARSRTIRNRIGARQAVFHRAFDVTPDPFRALEELIDLGITRVLTSGQRNGAPQGSSVIKQLIERARGRIEVLPGAGIGLDDIGNLVTATGCTQVHMTAFAEMRDTSTQANSQIKFGGALMPDEAAYELTDAGFVREVKEMLRAI